MQNAECEKVERRAFSTNINNAQDLFQFRNACYMKIRALIFCCYQYINYFCD